MYILGIDIGGTKCAAVTGEWDGKRMQILQKRVCATDLTVAPEKMLEKIFDMADGILTKAPDAVGISSGGPLDSSAGIIMGPPNLPGWDHVEIVRLTEKRFGSAAYLQNDANACAVAEWKFGAGRGFSNLVFLTFGTGLGAGLIIDGKLYEGTNGNAGEAGHVRLEEHGPRGYGKNGSFEGFCSGGGIAKLGYQMGIEAIKSGFCPAYLNAEMKESDVSAKLIAEAAFSGDETAKEVYRTSGKQLGRGLAMLIDILNPERIIIGGVYTRSHALMSESLEKELKNEALGESLKCCEITPAALGEEIGDYAALAVAVNGSGMDTDCDLIRRYPNLASCESDIAKAKDMLISCFESGGKLLLAGNGGSSADCDHIVGELMKGFVKKRPLSEGQRADLTSGCGEISESTLGKLQNALPAISLSSFTALNTAFANDVDPDLMYAQGVLGLGRRGDVLITISTSGNSKNTVEAAKIAKGLGLGVISLTGEGGGALAQISDVCIKAPEKETYKVQELHLPIYHYLCLEIEDHFFKE